MDAAAEPKYRKPEWLAGTLEISVRSVYRLVKDNPDLPVLKLPGGGLRFPAERVERWLRDREGGRAQPKKLAVVKAEAGL